MYYATSYKIGSVRNTWLDNLFKSGSELDKKIFRDRYEFVESVDEGLQKSIDEDFAFIWTAETVENCCSETHIAVPATVTDLPIVFLMKKNCPYKNMFNYFLLKLEETGQLSRMYLSWKSNTQKDCFSIEANSQGIFNVSTTFLVLGGAIVVSLSIMACEILLKRNVNKTLPETTNGK